MAHSSDLQLAPNLTFSPMEVAISTQNTREPTWMKYTHSRHLPWTWLSIYVLALATSLRTLGNHFSSLSKPQQRLRLRLKWVPWVPGQLLPSFKDQVGTHRKFLTFPIHPLCSLMVGPPSHLDLVTLCTMICKCVQHIPLLKRENGIDLSPPEALAFCLLPPLLLSFLFSPYSYFSNHDSKTEPVLFKLHIPFPFSLTLPRSPLVLLFV